MLHGQAGRQPGFLLSRHLMFKNTLNIFPTTDNGPDFVVFFKRDMSFLLWVL